MNNKKDENNIFKQLISTPRGRGILFFGAYFIFFLGIMILARFGDNGRTVNDTYDDKNYYYSFDNISADNYQFSYEMNIDLVDYLYEGSRTVDNELFTLNKEVEYYSNHDVYFTNTDGVWVNTKNPYLYKEFLDVNNIISFIENSTYISKTEYDSGKVIYVYAISSASISKILDNSDLDIAEVPNEIVVSVDEDNFVTEIKFKLDSYCKVKGICIENMQITLKYDLCGEIEEITSPLE